MAGDWELVQGMRTLLMGTVEPTDPNQPKQASQEWLEFWLSEPDVMLQERDFAITQRHLCEYLVEATRVLQRLREEARKRAENGQMVGRDDDSGKNSRAERDGQVKHDCEKMLKLIKQAERMRARRYPRAKDPNHPKYANGVAELLPNGKWEIVVADFANCEDPIPQWQRVHYFGLAYACALWFPERSFWVRQMSDVEPVPFVGLHNLEDQ